MADYGTTDNYDLRHLLGSSPVSDVDAGFQALAEDVDSRFVGFQQGAIALLPASTPGDPGIPGREYYATDTGQVLKDTGTGWIEPGWTPGDLKLSALQGTAQKYGWLVVAGQGVSSSFPNLRAALIDNGSVWGTDGSGNPKLPPADRALVIAGGSHGTGSLFGAATVALTTAQMPQHAHPVNDPGHHHFVNLFFTSQFQTSNRAPSGNGSNLAGAQLTENAPTGITVGNNGSGQGHDNVPPSAAVTVLVKT